jgi:hypothetical protein
MSWSHNQLEIEHNPSIWQERMKCHYSCARLEANLGMPRCGMGSIACKVELDFVVCLQHLARFCIVRKLINIYELEATAKNWKHTDAPDTAILHPTRMTPVAPRGRVLHLPVSAGGTNHL